MHQRNTDELLYFKHLNKKYQKFIYLFAKYKQHSSEESIDSIKRARFLINKLFKQEADLASNEACLSQVDASYLRLFMRQSLSMSSFPKSGFFFRYVKVHVSLF